MDGDGISDSHNRIDSRCYTNRNTYHSHNSCYSVRNRRASHPSGDNRITNYDCVDGFTNFFAIAYSDDDSNRITESHRIHNHNRDGDSDCYAPGNMPRAA